MTWGQWSCVRQQRSVSSNSPKNKQRPIRPHWQIKRQINHEGETPPNLDGISSGPASPTPCAREGRLIYGKGPTQLVVMIRHVSGAAPQGPGIREASFGSPGRLRRIPEAPPLGLVRARQRPGAPRPAALLRPPPWRGAHPGAHRQLPVLARQKHQDDPPHGRG